MGYEVLSSGGGETDFGESLVIASLFVIDAGGH